MKIKLKAKLLENLIIMRLEKQKDLTESESIELEIRTNRILGRTAQEIEKRLIKSGLAHENDLDIFVQNIENQLSWHGKNFALSFPDEKCSARFLEVLSSWKEVELKQLKLKDLGE